MAKVNEAVSSTDNLSFYHKVLLPLVLAAIVGMVSLQVTMLQSITRLQTQMESIQTATANVYTQKDAASDRKVQELRDGKQDAEIGAVRQQTESNAQRIADLFRNSKSKGGDL